MDERRMDERTMDERRSGGVSGRRPSLSRRSVLRMTGAAAGALAAARSGLLAGGAQGATGTPAPPAGMTPGVDYFPSTGPGVPEAFLTYPEPFQSVEGVPGNGGTVSILGGTQLPPITPRENNPYWQELDRRLGVTTERRLVPFSEYPQLMAVLLASDDVPDLTLVRFTLAPDLSRAVLQGAFMDLTPYLTPDTIGEYPNLARFPDYTYRYARIQDQLFGLPFQNFRVGANLLMYRHDWAETLAMPELANADEIYELLVGMSQGDPDGNGSPDTYGLAVNNTTPLLLPFLQAMFRVPNQWRLNDDGTLTRSFETEEFRQAIEFGRRLWESGAYHPDSGTMTNTEMQDALVGGRIGAYNGSPQVPFAVRAPRDAARELNPEADLRLLIPPGHDGGDAIAWNNTAVNGIVSIPARVGEDEERVRELLRIADYHAAPFGSEEFRFINFGVEGEHHTVEPSGALIRTDKGNADISEIHATLFPTRTYFFPTAEITADDLTYVQEVTARMLAIGVDDPTWTAFSPTSYAEAGVLTQLELDWINGIITGREPLEGLDTFISEWSNRGGDQIRRELEESLQAQ